VELGGKSCTHDETIGGLKPSTGDLVAMSQKVIDVGEESKCPPKRSLMG
jgi:hypothetical protein